MSLAKLRALIGALSAKLAAAQAALVAAATLIPFLPVAWQAKAAGLLLVAAGWVKAVAELVARVTPVPADAVGLTLPPGQQMRVEKVGPSFPAGHIPPS